MGEVNNDPRKYLGHFANADVLKEGHNTSDEMDVPKKLIIGKSALPDDLKGPTGKDYRAKGGAVATEIVGTFDTPKGKFINAPLLVPGQTEVKRLLKGKTPKHEQVVRALKYAKKNKAERFDTVEDAENAEMQRHEKLEKYY